MKHGQYEQHGQHGQNEFGVPLLGRARPTLVPRVLPGPPVLLVLRLSC